ncbi:NADPH-quinone reductase [Weissella oryzae SG25]|uniref:NADPH-quinone reductase n=1 Tax=Weissella oryzae (strain DSM 25784 / JCM 18191 / LMG 30913 / SG25) TaxID=1329250 RepID=A0A069CWV8_WEIOS|nr:hypothetical protein [Weissella oryzae]GAK31959.1 NADPH-quinone reductase [Weissella oryzae SG25]
MKKNLLERMQRSNEYNRPEYFPLYANSSIVGYIKQGGKKYTGNENIAVKDNITEKVVPLSVQANYKSEHLLSEYERQLVRKAWPAKESVIRRLSRLWSVSE